MTIDSDTPQNSGDLSPRVRALLDAHVNFELERLRDPAALRDFVARELGEVYDWLADQSIERLADPDRIVALLRRRLLEREPGGQSAVLAENLAAALRERMLAHSEPVADVLSREAFDLLVEDLGGDEQLRRTSVHGMVNNAVFSLLIAEILFHGIEDFMLESRFTQSIPGAQSLFKFGQNLLNQTAPGLKDGIEKTIKEFIKNNAGRIIQNSEAAVHKSLGPDTIRQASEQFWNEFATRPISEIASTIPGEKLPLYRRAGDMFLERFRRSGLAADLLETAVRAFFESHRDRPLSGLFEEAGLDRASFVAELGEIAQPLIEAALAGDFLAGLIRRRLLAFYSSEEAHKLISQG